MADQTVLPTCTPGSLGGPKLDRRPFSDPKKDDSAAEIMLRNACLEELFRRIGLSMGWAEGTVEARLAELEAVADSILGRLDTLEAGPMRTEIVPYSASPIALAGMAWVDVTGAIDLDAQGVSQLGLAVKNEGVNPIEYIRVEVSPDGVRWFGNYLAGSELQPNIAAGASYAWGLNFMPIGRAVVGGVSLYPSGQEDFVFKYARLLLMSGSGSSCSVAVWGM